MQARIEFGHLFKLVNPCVVEREEKDVFRAAPLQVVHNAARVLLEDEGLHRHPPLRVELRDRRRSLARRHLRVFERERRDQKTEPLLPTSDTGLRGLKTVLTYSIQQ